MYSLDAKTGCIHWKFKAESGVRTAINFGKGNDGNVLAYFGDMAANVYAVNAATGALLWKLKVENYPTARITALRSFRTADYMFPLLPWKRVPEQFPHIHVAGSTVASSHWMRRAAV